MKIPTTQENSTKYFEELPFHLLIEVDLTTLTEDQLRGYVTVTQNQRQSAQKRNASLTKESKKIGGTGIDVSKYI
jgi:hypothetical protein